jgi:hypothetical protein
MGAPLTPAIKLAPRTLDLAEQDAHDRQDHGHLDGHRKDTDTGAQGPMQQVADD